MTPELVSQLERLQELNELDEKIKDCMLGQSETRYDLIDLQNKVKEEIRKLRLDMVKSYHG